MIDITENCTIGKRLHPRSVDPPIGLNTVTTPAQLELKRFETPRNAVGLTIDLELFRDGHRA